MRGWQHGGGTSQWEFFATYDDRGLPPIDVAFIDGNHSFEDVRHDFIEVCRHTRRNSYLLLHDTNLYVREMIRHAGVKRWLRIVKRDAECFEVVDFPFSSGVGLLSPADGTVVYVKRVEPGAPVVVIKEGVAATVQDILREDATRPKLVVGIFMSPFDVHYNRAPLAGGVTFVRRHPARPENAHMGPMHWRSVAGLEPRYEGSMHIVQNERTVTAFDGDYRGEPMRCYVVQIGALTVNGIDSYVPPGGRVGRGQTFGMIRIGSQVDLIVPWRDSFRVAVRAGDLVRAGESILVR